MKKFYDRLKIVTLDKQSNFELKGKKLSRNDERGKCFVNFEFSEEWDDDLDDVIKLVDIFLCYNIKKITCALKSMSPNIESSYVINMNHMFSDRSLDNESKIDKIIVEILLKLDDLDEEIINLFSPSYYYLNYFSKKEGDNKQLVFEFFMPSDITNEEINELMKRIQTFSRQDSMSQLMKDETNSLLEYLQKQKREQL